MDKNSVIDFFDSLAPRWDADMVKDEKIISDILDGAGVERGKNILDVACGTGVMIPYYLEREAGHITGIDISPKMVEIARGKFGGKADIICGDAETYDFQDEFDCIVIYNAFPHFPDPKGLIESLSAQLRPGGTLTVAHGMSREKIDRHHSGTAAGVSNGLMHEEELAALFPESMEIIVKISDDRMYQVTGLKK